MKKRPNGYNSRWVLVFLYMFMYLYLKIKTLKQGSLLSLFKSINDVSTFVKINFRLLPATIPRLFRRIFKKLQEIREKKCRKCLKNPFGDPLITFPLHSAKASVHGDGCALYAPLRISVSRSCLWWCPHPCAVLAALVAAYGLSFLIRCRCLALCRSVTAFNGARCIITKE